MPTVIDASVLAAQFLPDEKHSSRAQVLLEQLDPDDLIVPRIFWYEIARRNRTDELNSGSSQLA